LLLVHKDIANNRNKNKIKQKANRKPKEKTNV